MFTPFWCNFLKLHHTTTCHSPMWTQVLVLLDQLTDQISWCDNLLLQELHFIDKLATRVAVHKQVWSTWRRTLIPLSCQLSTSPDTSSYSSLAKATTEISLIWVLCLFFTGMHETKRSWYSYHRIYRVRSSFYPWKHDVQCVHSGSATLLARICPRNTENDSSNDTINSKWVNSQVHKTQFYERNETSKFLLSKLQKPQAHLIN